MGGTFHCVLFITADAYLVTTQARPTRVEDGVFPLLVIVVRKELVMSSEPVRTYVATEATPIYQDTEQTKIAENGTAMLPRKAKFSGQRVENNMVWISPGVGFVPAGLALECNQYQAPAVIYVRTEPRDGAPIAESGTGQLAQGSIFDAGVYTGGWLWLTSDLGYIRSSEAILKGVSSVTYP